MGIIKTDDGLINLIEAMVKQAEDDAKSKDEDLANEAKEWLENLRKDFQ